MVSVRCFIFGGREGLIVFRDCWYQLVRHNFVAKLVYDEYKYWVYADCSIVI